MPTEFHTTTFSDKSTNGVFAITPHMFRNLELWLYVATLRRLTIGKLTSQQTHIEHTYVYPYPIKRNRLELSAGHHML